MPLQFDFLQKGLVRSIWIKALLMGLPQGEYVLPLIETGFAYLMSNKPVSSPDDLTNLKVWVPEGDPW